MAKITLKIDGMTCPVCSDKVDGALKSAKGVTDVSVNLKKGTAVVHYDESETDPKKLVRTVIDAGYRAEIKHGLF
ncbi:MAG: heavy-metal-associated domain-containing protein [Candidatus Methanomethylophilaceae archaeon]|jgi:copper chaperone CopZ